MMRACIGRHLANAPEFGSRIVTLKTLLAGFWKLLPRDSQRGLVETGRTPAHVFFQMTNDAGVEQGKHDAQHTRIGVESAYCDLFNLPPLETGDIPGQEAIAGLFDDQVAGLRRQKKKSIG